jgi:hypothetical protein
MSLRSEDNIKSAWDEQPFPFLSDLVSHQPRMNKATLSVSGF